MEIKEDFYEVRDVNGEKIMCKVDLRSFGLGEGELTDKRLGAMIVILQNAAKACKKVKNPGKYRVKNGDFVHWGMNVPKIGE